MLFFGWFLVLELFERFGDISWHREVYLSAFVIPIEGDAYASFSCPVVGDFVVLFQSCFEMQCVFFTNVFDSKLIS